MNSTRLSVQYSMKRIQEKFSFRSSVFGYVDGQRFVSSPRAVAIETALIRKCGGSLWLLVVLDKYAEKSPASPYIIVIRIQETHCSLRRVAHLTEISTEQGGRENESREARLQSHIRELHTVSYCPIFRTPNTKPGAETQPTTQPTAIAQYL